MLTEKEKIILNTLLRNKEELSIKEIAILTKIKERTLYREMKSLDESLRDSGVKLVKNKSRYRLEGNIEEIDTSLLDTSMKLAYSQDNRINLILANLVLEQETSIKEISEKLYIAYNTVVNAVNSIEKILTDYHLELIKKKGQGISLVGSLENKRILLISILNNEIADDEFFYTLNNLGDYSSNPFFKFLDLKLLRSIFLENRDLEIFRIYTDSSIKKLLIAIQVGLNLVGIDEEVNEYISKSDESNILKLVNIIDSYKDLDKKDSFVAYIAKILKTCKLIEQVTYFNDKYSYTLIYKVNRLISAVSAKSHIDFKKDTNLAVGLIPHIESAIKRYQLKLVERNNELQEFVLKNYNELYLVIKSVILEIFDDIDFSATELSYIVIHFASSYEQIYRENFVRALVVCSAGIGSSKILGSLIRKNIPEIKNIEYSNPARLRQDLAKDYDIVLSTIRLDADIDYILIPTILREEDTTRIKEKILATRTFKKLEYKRQDRSEVSNHIDNILNNINFSAWDRGVSDLAAFLASQLALNREDYLVKNLIERHEKSSIVIPNTGIALFHTLDNSLKTPFIKIVGLDRELIMENSLGHEEKIKQIFIMLSPNIQEYTDLLGQISIAILSDEIFRKILDSRDIDYIKTKIELILTKYKLEN
ncbi:BglG family transcription antiterminator [Gemella sp. GL1.1]|nr:BglG family transcription antiterminator [Gemella sp. GL1.1]MBF0747330.1 BglG family transcription antiterminator [Gemella sp. 19428wG2_WT2a]NYS27303.1 BglG family transcription antiterminator [Gemella sp. GL1]TFU57542.1 PRD domain-containing protein [Gemella sp. WT2a]